MGSGHEHTASRPDGAGFQSRVLSRPRQQKHQHARIRWRRAGSDSGIESEAGRTTRRIETEANGDNGVEATAGSAGENYSQSQIKLKRRTTMKTQMQNPKSEIPIQKEIRKPASKALRKAVRCNSPFGIRA